MLRRLITLALVFLIVLTSPVTGGPSRGSVFSTAPDRIQLSGHVPAALQRATRLPGIQLAATAATDAESSSEVLKSRPRTHHSDAIPCYTVHRRAQWRPMAYSATLLAGTLEEH